MIPLKSHIKQLAVMRLDVSELTDGSFGHVETPAHNLIFVIPTQGDMYESTVDVLYNLYDKLSIGGYVIMDDVSMKHVVLFVSSQIFENFDDVTFPMPS